MILSQIISAIALIILNPCVCLFSKNTFQDHCQTGRKHVKYGKAVLDSSKNAKRNAGRICLARAGSAFLRSTERAKTSSLHNLKGAPPCYLSKKCLRAPSPVPTLSPQLTVCCHPTRMMSEHDFLYILDGTWEVIEEGIPYELRDG